MKSSYEIWSIKKKTITKEQLIRLASGLLDNFYYWDFIDNRFFDINNKRK